jgi:hypothetical protein
MSIKRAIKKLLVYSLVFSLGYCSGRTKEKQASEISFNKLNSIEEFCLNSYQNNIFASDKNFLLYNNYVDANKLNNLENKLSNKENFIYIR